MAKKIATAPARKSAETGVDLSRYRIAVLVPCYNEEAAVDKVVAN